MPMDKNPGADAPEYIPSDADNTVDNWLDHMANEGLEPRLDGVPILLGTNGVPLGRMFFAFNPGVVDDDFYEHFVEIINRAVFAGVQQSRPVVEQNPEGDAASTNP